MTTAIKIGALCLCLMTLPACSATKPTTPKTVVQTQVIYPTCPNVPLCQSPSLSIRNNGDLANKLLQSQQAIATCQLAISTLQSCLTPPKEPQP